MPPRGVPLQGPARDAGSVSVSVRRIDNGYVTTRSEVNARGDCRVSESFTEARPNVSVDVSTPRIGGTMKRAISALKPR